MTPECYLIDGHIVAAMLLDETTGHIRESGLDMDYCLSRDHAGGDHSYYVAARAPKSFTNPHLDHTTAGSWKLSDALKGHQSGDDTLTCELKSGTIHIRNEIYVPIFSNKVSDSYINLNDYIKCTKTGRLEWMHPPCEALLPEWLETVLSTATAMSKTPTNAFEVAVDLAKDQITSSLVPGAPDASKEWMKDTYVDNGQLIRHGV